MSLECEGDGVPCAECGDFDFLPHTCLHCRGVFCAAHASCHHVPSSSNTQSPSVLCAPPSEPISSSSCDDTAVDTERLSGSILVSQVRCVVCGAFPCVLTPCLLCGEAYCAVHRFHGHEDEALQARLRRRAEPVPIPSSDAPAGSLRAVCLPFSSAHPLVLAPVGYRSRRMDVLALVVQLPSPPAAWPPASESAGAPVSTASISSAPTAAPAAASAVAAAADDVGVCSLIVATEMSMGQLRERLEGALKNSQEPASTSAAVVSAVHPTLFSVTPVLAKPGSDCVASSTFSSSSSSSSSRHHRPLLSVHALPPDAIVRNAPIVNAALVMAVVPAGATMTELAVAERLCGVLGDYLFVAGRSAAPRDDRVKALATRLHLQHQQLCRGRATGGSTLAQKRTSSAEQLSVKNATAATRDSASVNSTTDLNEAKDAFRPRNTDAAAVAVWPFRHAPPLNSFPFFNSKMNPCGAGAIRPAASPRVVVALFIADATLPCAVKPMCVALGKEWPMARVVSRLHEEAVEQQCGAHRVAAAQLLNAFSLYRLGQTEEAMVECLWVGRSATSAAVAASSPLLHNADVLVLCPAEPPGPMAAVEEELHRLHSLTGKDKRALKADQIKLCSIM